MKRLALTLLALALVTAVATSTASAKRLKQHAARHSVQVHTAKLAPGHHALRRAARGLI
jgi:hypothetical protein